MATALPPAPAPHPATIARVTRDEKIAALRGAGLTEQEFPIYESLEDVFSSVPNLTLINRLVIRS